MKRLVTLFIPILFFLPVWTPAFAVEAPIPYSVEVLHPQNQLDYAKDYFDLLVSPGSDHEVSVVLHNYSDKPLALRVIPQNATTSSTGTLDYTGRGKLLEETMSFRFTDICSPAQNITLEAGESKHATFVLAAPKEPFEGVLLGAFQVFEDSTLAAQDSSANLSTQNTNEEPATNVNTGSRDGGVEIQNRFTYIVGAMLQMTRAVPTPDFVLESIVLDTWNDRFALTASLNQLRPTIVKNYTMTGEVVSKSTGASVHSFSWENFSMAPNSVFAFSEKLNPDSLPSGEYTMFLQVHGNQKEWALEKDFSVLPVQKFQTMSETVDGTSNTLMIIVIITLLALITLTIGRIGYRAIKRRQE